MAVAIAEVDPENEPQNEKDPELPLTVMPTPQSAGTPTPINTQTDH